MLDKHGNCPACGRDWNGGDVLEEISKIELLINTTDKELVTAAESFGWETENKVRFSKVKTIQIEDKTYFQCHNIRCGTIFDAETGERYESMYDIKQVAKYPMIPNECFIESEVQEVVNKFVEAITPIITDESPISQLKLTGSEEVTLEDGNFHYEFLIKPVEDEQTPKESIDTSANFTSLSKFLKRAKK